jgi:hypothetical protein
MAAPLADPRDPFQLDRLAEELASRELSPHPDRSSAPRDLPLYVPLSHSNPYLAAPFRAGKPRCQTYVLSNVIISAA